MPEASEPWIFSGARQHAIATDGQQALLFEVTRSDVRVRAAFTAPTGEPSALAGEPRLDPCAVSWWGSPGPFRVQGTLVNRGQSVADVAVRMRNSGAIVPERFTLLPDSETPSSALFEEGDASLPGALLPLDTSIPFILEGSALSEGDILFDVLHLRRVIGEIALGVSLKRSLRCERAGQVLALDPQWVTALQLEGLLDFGRPAPDLERWRVRASVSAARDGGGDALVQQRFLELSATERSLRAPHNRIFAFKFARKGPWQITSEEAAILARRLGADHPLGGFAGAGAFVIVEG